MSPLLRQFLAEGREFLQDISEKLLQLEKAPTDAALLGDLFRSVHTLKGNAGLFEFPEMSRVLHAAEDLMSVVREGQLPYSPALADRLLDGLDFIGLLFDCVEVDPTAGAMHAATSVTLAAGLRDLIGRGSTSAPDSTGAAAGTADRAPDLFALTAIPEGLRAAWLRRPADRPPLSCIVYRPERDCFFKGEDPFHQARQTPALEWYRLAPTEPWPPAAEFDPYQCTLQFQLVSSAAQADLVEHFRYVPEQVQVVIVDPDLLRASLENGLPTAKPSSPTVAAAQPSDPAARAVIDAQVAVLKLPTGEDWLPGRVKAAITTLAACYTSIGRGDLVASLQAAFDAALSAGRVDPVQTWLEAHAGSSPDAPPISAVPAGLPGTPGVAAPSGAPAVEAGPAQRGDDKPAVQKTLKVDQDKIDRLMGLIGEMVVAKNSLPYLANRAETVHGSREMAREIKAQHAVINRIAEEMQDVIMQVRMTPVSTVFQRFPRLVRDISRKLDKQVALKLEGEDTEADKNIIEALADPLIHIVRNSLDHGIELPAIRIAAGKPAEGTLLIRASQQADRVTIDISDDGKGIDPAVVKRKALEKGIIDQALADRMSDRDAMNLVFAPGFSTADRVSDLSGRGVGMDVVRTAVEQVNGTVTLESVVGVGTQIRLSLPLSMAVTNVMIVESNKQIFGVPMDVVLETVRVPRADVRSIKNRQTTLLRDRVMPLRSLNEMLAANEPQITNDADEIAALVVQVEGERVGIIVDKFREVADIILKPMTGILGGLPGYAGSALMGDGSVLMVLNPKELVSWA